MGGLERTRRQMWRRPRTPGTFYVQARPAAHLALQLPNSSETFECLVLLLCSSQALKCSRAEAREENRVVNAGLRTGQVSGQRAQVENRSKLDLDLALWEHAAELPWVLVNRCTFCWSTMRKVQVLN